MPFCARSVTPAEAPEADWRSHLARLLLAGALVVGLLALVPSLQTAWGIFATIAISLVYVLLSAVVVLRAEFRLQVIGLVLIILRPGTCRAILHRESRRSHLLFFRWRGLRLPALVASQLAL